VWRIPWRWPCAPIFRRSPAPRRRLAPVERLLARVRARRERVVLGSRFDGAPAARLRALLSPGALVLRQGTAADVRAFQLLGEVRLLGGALGNGPDGRGGIGVVVPTGRLPGAARM